MLLILKLIPAHRSDYKVSTEISSSLSLTRSSIDGCVHVVSPCHFFHRGTWVSGLSCAWRHHPGGQSPPSGSLWPSPPNPWSGWNGCMLQRDIYVKKCIGISKNLRGIFINAWMQTAGSYHYIQFVWSRRYHLFFKKVKNCCVDKIT